MRVRLNATAVAPSIIDDLKQVFGNYPGDAEVELAIETTGGSRTLKLGPQYRVAPTPTLRAELEHILGPAAVGA
jgi:DNA polymerase-3 subunit alpha